MRGFVTRSSGSLIAVLACCPGRWTGAVRISDSTATGADENQALEDFEAEFHEFIDPIREKASAMAQTAVGTGAKETYDDQFFTTNCDLTEHESETFDRQEYKLLNDQVEDDKNWQEFRQCVNPNLGMKDPALRVNDFAGTAYECATLCSDKSRDYRGEVVCCMHHATNKKCEMHVGWQSLKPSSYAGGILGWIRKPIKARLILTPAMTEPFQPDQETNEVTNAQAGQEVVAQLVSQVNDMSVDGILDSLLSFYICMRWIPDTEFLNLALHELRTVSVDEKTPKMPQVTEDEILNMYLDSHLTPLRCGSAMNVQDVVSIDKLLVSLNTSSAPMSRLYSFSKTVQEAGRSWFFKRNNLKEAMSYEGSEDSVYVQDMRALARHPDALPWATFVRSSNYYSHHVSNPKNAFLICFGPRVASFPHKRAGGGHILADANMAGCNGFWDQTTMVDHMSRIKKLFAPEMCFTYALRKELKQQFLRTFVTMNEGFEDAMKNRYSKKVHLLDPAKGFDGDNALSTDDPSRIGDGKARKKYQRTAELLGNAHAKWIICPTKPEVTGKIGVEDGFFSEPRAYEKWIGKLTDETYPECRSIEDSTGCAVCVIAVKDEHGCHARMNVTLSKIFKAASTPTEKYPFLRSQYSYEEMTRTQDGKEQYVVKKATGTCMVRKSSATMSEASRGGDIQDMKDAFFNVNDSDAVVNVISTEDPGEGGRIDSVFRFPVRARRAEFETVRMMDVMPPDSHVDRLLDNLNRETFSDPVEEWAQKFIFTADVPAVENHPAHKVDYFVSCPCSQTNFDPSNHFNKYGSLGFAEYWNR